MLIHELAKKYNLSLRTLRYYEEIGLLSPSRNPSNIRDYESSEIEKLELILLFKLFNFTLASIKEILTSKDTQSLKEKLQIESNVLSDTIHSLSYKKQLIQSLLLTSNNQEISHASIRSFISEQLYFTTNDERTIAMIEKTDSTILEIGTGLIPLASPEFGEPLLKAIKETREHFENLYEKKLPLIRVRDNEALNPFDFCIIYLDKIITKETVQGKDIPTQSAEIIDLLKPFLLLT